MILTHKLIEICNLGLSDEKTIELVEKAIADSKPYDHNHSDSRVACKVSDRNLDIDFSAGTQSALVEQIEKQFSKRELAFLTHHITWKVSEVSYHWLFGRFFRRLFRG